MEELFSQTIIGDLPTHIRERAIRQVAAMSDNYTNTDVCRAAIGILAEYWDQYHDDEYLRKPDVSASELSDALEHHEGVETLHVGPYEKQSISVEGPAVVHIVTT